jgi:hypothetical protein
MRVLKADESRGTTITSGLAAGDAPQKEKGRRFCAGLERYVPF